MADIILNIAKGRWAEWFHRVDQNDPTNAVIIVGLLASSGVESDATLRDKDSLSDLVSGATNEATNTGYARKVLTDSDIAAVAADDTNDRMDVTIADQTWTGLANDGTGAISDLFVAYDPDSTGGADSAILVISVHDFSITPDGSDVTADVGTVLLRAS